MNLYSADSKFLLRRYVAPRFTAYSDYELVAMAQNIELPRLKRDMAARTLLIRHLAAIKNQCRQYTFGGMVTDNTMQCACEGFLKAIQRFDLKNEKQVKFLTFAWWYIRKGAQKSLTEKVRFEAALPLEEAASVPDRSAENMFDLKSDVRDAVEKVVVDPQVRYIFDSYYGLGGNPPQELKVIAQRTGKQVSHLKRTLRSCREALKRELVSYDKHRC